MVNEVVGTLRERRVTILAAYGAGLTDLDEAVIGLLVAPDRLVDSATQALALASPVRRVRSGRPRADLRAESLNLATAAAVCLYAPARRSSPHSIIECSHVAWLAGVASPWCFAQGLNNRSRTANGRAGLVAPRPGDRRSCLQRQAAGSANVDSRAGMLTCRWVSTDTR